MVQVVSGQGRVSGNMRKQGSESHNKRSKDWNPAKFFELVNFYLVIQIQCQFVQINSYFAWRV